MPVRVLVVVRRPEDAFAVVRREMRRREEGGCRVVFLGNFEWFSENEGWRRRVEGMLGGELARRLARILALRLLWRCLGRRGVAFVECW